jgi:hypothetical protein
MRTLRDLLWVVVILVGCWLAFAALIWVALFPIRVLARLIGV